MRLKSLGWARTWSEAHDVGATLMYMASERESRCESRSRSRGGRVKRMC